MPFARCLVAARAPRAGAFPLRLAAVAAVSPSLHHLRSSLRVRTLDLVPARSRFRLAKNGVMFFCTEPQKL